MASNLFPRAWGGSFTPSSLQCGGYSLEFVGEVSDRFNCQICTKVIREPHLAVCCGKHFCELCLKKWFSKHGRESCPHCRAEGHSFNHVINKGLRSEVNQLKINCRNRSKGCEWTGEVGQLKTHLASDKGCGFEVVKCPNKCYSFRVLMRKDLDDHLKSECQLRQYQCKYCGLTDTYQSITGESLFQPQCHYDVCLEFPLACPNECGTSGIKRKDMESHRLNSCTQEPVECPFAEAGCNIKLLRDQLEDHVSSNLQQHLLLVMGAYKQVKDELQDTEARLTTAVQLLKRGKEADKKTIDSIISYPDHLKCKGDSIEVLMPQVHEYHRSGQTWYSRPFYYGAGYKMCLGVKVNKLKFGDCIYVSIKICSLEGGRSNWPMTCFHREFQFINTMQVTADCRRFAMCSQGHPPLAGISCAQDLQVEGRSFCLVGDCLTFNVMYVGYCFLKIRIL